MNKKPVFLVMPALLLALGLVLAGCPTDDDSGGSGSNVVGSGNTFVSLIDVTAGGLGLTTTQLTLTFDQAIPGLSANDITLSGGVSGVSKGTLSGSGPVYILPISGFTTSGGLTVTVAKAGYVIIGSPKAVGISYSTDSGDVVVTVSGVTANGSSSQTTTQLTLSFGSYLFLWSHECIYLSGVSGVSKGTLQSSSLGILESTYILPISGFTSGGDLTVTVAMEGLEFTPSSQTVTIYYSDGGGGDTAVTFSGVTANGSSSQTTTQLTLDFSQAITGLSASDITLSGVSGVSKGTLSGSGPTYILPISGFTGGGTLSVAVSKSGYDISGSPKTVTIYYYSGGGGGLTNDIDPALYGVWKDSAGMFDVTFASTGITWGGSVGSSLNTVTSSFQGSGYTFVWVANNGNIGYAYSYNGGATQTATAYNYTLTGNSLELKTSGYTFATLTKQ